MVFPDLLKGAIRSILTLPFSCHGLLGFSALPLRSEYIVFVGACYGHVTCTNSKLGVLYIYDRPTNWTTMVWRAEARLYPNTQNLRPFRTSCGEPVLNQNLFLFSGSLSDSLLYMTPCPKGGRQLDLGDRVTNEIM